MLLCVLIGLLILLFSSPGVMTLVLIGNSIPITVNNHNFGSFPSTADMLDVSQEDIV